MNRHALSSFLLLPLVACAAQRSKTESGVPQGASSAHYTYRAAVNEVPASAKDVRLTVRVPLQSSAGELQRLTAFGLVGNAPFELEVPDETGELVRNGMTVRWSRLMEPGVGPRSRMVEVETAGKPVELGLRIGLSAPAAVSEDAMKALETELRARTSLDLDRVPSQAIVASFERPK